MLAPREHNFQLPEQTRPTPKHKFFLKNPYHNPPAYAKIDPNG